MIFEFKRIKIDGFMSIGSAVLQLDDRGIILVNGKNLYEDKSESNGSGKSSLLESIVWTLYGKTSKGISNPVNKYTGLDNCFTELEFSVDGKDYTISRFINYSSLGTGVQIFQDSENISGRNKTDSDKIIVNSILKMNQDIFQSTIFLNQGFYGRLSILGPSAMKERLENLSNISERIYLLSNDFNQKKFEYNQRREDLSNEISTINGKLTMIEQDIIRLESIVNDSKNVEKPSVSLDEVRDSLEFFNKDYYDFIDTRNSLERVLSETNSAIRIIEDSISKNNKRITQLDSLMNSTSSGICPTCKQTINKNISESLMEEYKREYLENEEKITEDNNSLTEKKNYIEILTNKISSFNDKISVIRRKIDAFKELENKYSKIKDVTNEELEIKTKSELKKSLSDSRIDLESEINDVQNMLDVISNCLKLVSKQFRNYELDNVIKFMNSRLAYYSSFLFSNKELISINSVSSKLEIKFGDTDYIYLSGGEQRKVDIALMLAQRDIAMNVSNFTSNILIFDEVFDNLDSLSIDVVSELLYDVSNTVQSIFIISHKEDVNLRYDSVITVVKEKNRISNILD